MSSLADLWRVRRLLRSARIPPGAPPLDLSLTEDPWPRLDLLGETLEVPPPAPVVTVVREAPRAPGPRYAPWFGPTVIPLRPGVSIPGEAFAVGGLVWAVVLAAAIVAGR